MRKFSPKETILINTRTKELKTAREVALEYSCVTPNHILNMVNGNKPNKTEYEIYKRAAGSRKSISPS